MASELTLCLRMQTSHYYGGSCQTLLLLVAKKV